MREDSRAVTHLAISIPILYSHDLLASHVSRKGFCCDIPSWRGDGKDTVAVDPIWYWV